jgi:CheY-like chemotaxis protein
MAPISEEQTRDSARDASAAPALADRTPGPGRPRRVLVVEDDTATRLALSALLRRRGLDVLAVATVDRAMELVGWVPDWVVLDLMLPGRNGVEMLRQLRAWGRAWQERTRVAVVTATNDPQLLAEVQALKPDAFFPKPLDLNAFIARVQTT